MEVPAGLGDRLSRLIDEKAEEEQRFFRPNKSRRNWRWIGSVAATILVIIGSGYGVETYVTFDGRFVLLHIDVSFKSGGRSLNLQLG